MERQTTIHIFGKVRKCIRKGCQRDATPDASWASTEKKPPTKGRL